MKSVLVTVSDDRMGRKGGEYGYVQRVVSRLFTSFHCPDEMRFSSICPLTFEDILKTSFYKNHRTLLDNIDPAKNGRVYKPFAISEALRRIDYGDMLVYTDCSPEIWSGCGSCWLEDGSLKTLYKVCEANDGILTHFVKWDTRHIPNGDLGIHTHENFTSTLCLRTMDLMHLEKSYQHASGMIVMIKSDKTVQFVDEWLYYNTDDRCACLGRADVDGDYSYWTDSDEDLKMGHRHDQSISGLLMNKYKRNLISINYDHHQVKLHQYLFINLCYNDVIVTFINSNYPSPTGRIRKGDFVLNEAGQRVKVFEIWPDDDGLESLVVGFHRHSAYKTKPNRVTRL